ncbi:unnamed protein product, partial [Symbiodinium pilosum]
AIPPAAAASSSSNTRPAASQAAQGVAPQAIMVPVFYQVQAVMPKQAQAPNAPMMPVAVAFAQPAVASHVCAVQDVRKLHEKVQIEEEAVNAFSAASTEQKGSTNDDDNDELSSLTSSEEPFQRALSALPCPEQPLPVERTFIQFSNKAFIHRRRSRSV